MNSTLRLCAVATAGMIAGMAVCGCYSTRRVEVGELARPGDGGTYRLSLRNGTVLRVLVSPAYVVTRDAVGCRHMAFDATSWQIRYGGFPTVYRAGRSWRQETVGEVIQIQTNEIANASVEELDWIRTTLASPVLLPAGFLDFIADNAHIGFGSVNDRFDSFSRPPRSVAGTSPP